MMVHIEGEVGKIENELETKEWIHGEESNEFVNQR